MGLEHKDLLDEILMSALYFMVFVAGIEIGGNRHIIKKICNPQSILLAVAIPTAVTIGSLGGAALSAFVTGMEMRDALLVGSALGWYSLSSVVISTLYSVEIGTIAFLANMLREVCLLYTSYYCRTDGPRRAAGASGTQRCAFGCCKQQDSD